MANIRHSLIPEAELHNPKGYTSAATFSACIKSEKNISEYQLIESLPSALNFVDGNAAPPTSVNGDIYVIFDGGGGVVETGWNGVSFNSWVRYDGVQWNEVVPADGFFCYDKTASELKKFNGASWVTAGGGESNTASNVGLGDGVFKQKTGVNLEFKSLTAGAGVTLTPGADEIQISASGSNIYNSDGTLTASRTVDQNNFNLNFINSTLGFGTSLPAATSRVHILGKGTTSGTTAFLVQNNISTNLFEVKDDGVTSISNELVLTDGSANNITLRFASGFNFGIGLSNTGLAFNSHTTGDFRYYINGIGTGTELARINSVGSLINTPLSVSGLFSVTGGASALLNNTTVTGVLTTVGANPLVLNNAGTNCYSEFQNSGATKMQFGILGGHGFLYTPAGTNIDIYVGSAGKNATWFSGGNLRIGTGADSGDTLQVNGSFRFDGALSVNGAAGFTGTGAYTNFTIVNGIITAAS